MRHAIALMFMISGIAAGPVAAMQIVDAFPHLSFSQPVDIQNAGDGSGRLFIVERAGLVRVVANDPSAASSRVFLDIRDRVASSGNPELGLLGLVFHPAYPDSPYVFVDYTATPGSGINPARTVVSRFAVSAANPDSAVVSSELVVLEVDQPYLNHNGGQLAFGPDGYLYVAMGDGGLGGDPDGNGQNPETLLGSLLRIDVDQPDGGVNYSIPPDNPFAGNTQGLREEIFAYGFRNPWRFSFDAAETRLWVADVGQSAWEEIDVVSSGENYGWNVMEGNHCYPSDPCDMTGLVLPVWEYAHPNGFARSVTGGYVYRGTMLPALVGRYIYADYITGQIWSLEYDGVSPAVNTLLLVAPFRISSFGLDEAGEIYVCDYSGGKVRRLVPVPSGIAAQPPEPSWGTLLPNNPNPFGLMTRIGFVTRVSARTQVIIYDVAGRAVRHFPDRIVPAGSYGLEWDGRDDSGTAVSSGVYFCRLLLEGQGVASRRMVLLR